MIRLILRGERPQSWNKHWSGGHWSERKAEADRVHSTVRAAINPDAAAIFELPVKITVSAWFKNRPVDADNICAKPYIDALIGWYIVDDKPTYVTTVTTCSYIDKRRPRVEIEITPFVVPF